MPSVTGPIQGGRAGLVERVYGDLKINSSFISNCSNIPAPGCIPSERGNCRVLLPREGGSGVPPHFRWLLKILKIKKPYHSVKIGRKEILQLLPFPSKTNMKVLISCASLWVCRPTIVSRNESLSASATCRQPVVVRSFITHVQQIAFRKRHLLVLQAKIAI